MPFKIGDMVQNAYHPRQGEAPKLFLKWAGKFQVKQVYQNGLVVVTNERVQTLTENIDNLRLFHSRPVPVIVHVTPVEDSINETSKDDDDPFSPVAIQINLPSQIQPIPDDLTTPPSVSPPPIVQEQDSLII